MSRSFNGSSDQCNFSTTFTIGHAPITLSSWIYPTSFPNSYNCVYGHDGSGGNNYAIILAKSSGKMAWYVSVGAGGGSNASVDPGAATLSANTWYHVAMSYGTSNGLKTYINGASDGTASGGTNDLSGIGSNATLAAGYDSQNAGRNFAGRIAEVAYWNAELTAGEISALAQGCLPINIRSASFLHWAPLDGLQSPEPDLSGAKSNGTLTGTTSAAGPPVAMFTPRWPIYSAPPTAAAYVSRMLMVFQ